MNGFEGPDAGGAGEPESTPAFRPFFEEEQFHDWEVTDACASLYR